MTKNKQSQKQEDNYSSLNKDDVFVSFKIYPFDKNSNNTRYKKYYHNSSVGGSGLLSYMLDVHGLDNLQKDSENYYVSPVPYDAKYGFKEPSLLAPIHPHSNIISGIISFSDKVSLQILNKDWTNIAHSFFINMLKQKHWDINQWEFQAVCHFNTNNKHLHFRMYQPKTVNETKLVKPKQALFTKNQISNIKNITKESLIYTIKQTNPNSYVHNFNYNLNQPLLKKNAYIRKNVLHFIKTLKTLNHEFEYWKNQEVNEFLNSLANYYFSHSVLAWWVKTNIKDNPNLEKEVVKIMTNNIKQHLIENLYQINDKQVKDFLGFNFQAQNVEKQKFKKFSHLPVNAQLKDLVNYSHKVIQKVYKMPLTQALNYVYNQDNFDLSQINDDLVAIFNQEKELNPEFIIPTLKIDKTKTH